MKKQIFLIAYAFLMLQVVACGQEKKVVSQVIATNNNSDKKLIEKIVYKKEELKDAILLEYGETNNIEIKFYNSEGELATTIKQDEYLKYHPYYETISELGKWQNKNLFLSDFYSLSNISIDRKRQLLKNISNKLDDKDLEQIDYISYGLYHLSEKDEISKVFLYKYEIVLGNNDRIIFSDSKILGIDSKQKQIFTLDKDVSSRYIKLVSDKWLFGRYNQFNNDSNSESFGKVGPYFIVTIPEGKEYILPQFLGFSNNFSEELPAGKYDMEKVSNINNQIFMTFSTQIFEDGEYKYFKYSAIVDNDNKTFKYARIQDRNDRSDIDLLLKEQLNNTNPHPFNLKKQK